MLLIFGIAGLIAGALLTWAAGYAPRLADRSGGAVLGRNFARGESVQRRARGRNRFVAFYASRNFTSASDRRRRCQARGADRATVWFSLRALGIDGRSHQRGYHGYGPPTHKAFKPSDPNPVCSFLVSGRDGRTVLQPTPLTRS